MDANHILRSMLILWIVTLPGAVQPFMLKTSPSFFIQQKIKSPTSTKIFGLSPSKVSTEHDDPTPEETDEPIEVIDPADIPELHYNKTGPIPHQPWRRGDPDGCQDPISADWRVEGEEIIRFAAESVGAKVHDVTWCMAQCIVTLSDTEGVEGTIDGPEIIIDTGDDYDENGTGHDYFGEPELDEEEYEDRIKTHPSYEIETLDDLEDDPRGEVDTSVIRAIGQAIMEALDDPDVEERLRISSRHEIVFGKEPTDPKSLITQKQFDAHLGENVQVETRDPWKSNRTLKGKLVSRDALDVYINADGNLVTIPQAFIYRVRLEKVP